MPPAVQFGPPMQLQALPAGAGFGPAAGSMFGGGAEAPPLSWLEDKQPVSGLNPFAQPFMPAAAASFEPPRHAQDDWHLQDQHQLQLQQEQEQEQMQYEEPTMTFEMQLYQEADGSYVPTLAQYSSGDGGSNSGSGGAGGRGGRRKVRAVRTRGGQSGGVNSADDINSLLALLPTDAK